MAEQPPTKEDDYSASATLTHFDRPLPLLRRPIPANPTDDPNLGPYVLAFPNTKSFFSSLNFCESKLLEQCEAGIRIGCSIIASNNCKPPWWKTLFGKIDFKERSECEDREMRACLQGSKEKCREFAKERCFAAFGSARIGYKEVKLRRKEVGGLISWVSGLGVFNGSSGFQMLAFDQLGLLSQLNLSYQVSNVRGFEFLGNRNQLK